MEQQNRLEVVRKMVHNNRCCQKDKVVDQDEADLQDDKPWPNPAVVETRFVLIVHIATAQQPTLIEP